MSEDFLYYVWQHKLFNKTNFFTTDNQKVHVVKTGILNTNSGPDFFNAQLKIDQQLWVGNVEMHLKSSDWYLHKHEEDDNYDAVILHVVWEHDATVFLKNNQVLPTLELKKLVHKELIQHYQNLMHSQQRWIPCEAQLKTVPTFVIDHWLERLYFERLEQKSTVIKEMLEHSTYDFEAVLFQILAKNFGLKVNGEAFLQLAVSVDFTVIKKVRFDQDKLTALLFGQAGFLEEELEDPYYLQLKKEYIFLKHKYDLQAISKNQFQFFRMRPPNFPSIRMVQLAALFYKQQHLFSKLMTVKNKKDFYALFTISVNDFWKTHYTFETESKKSAKQLSKSFVDLLIINTIIPLKFVYLKHKGTFINDEILESIRQVSAEKNSIISKFSTCDLMAKNALESQALLTLKNDYCTKKRCLQCAIGNYLLRN